MKEHVLCGVMNDNAPHKFIYLNVRYSAFGTIWEWLGGLSLGLGCEVSENPCQLSACAWAWRCELSARALAPCLPAAMLPPWWPWPLTFWNYVPQVKWFFFFTGCLGMVFSHGYQKVTKTHWLFFLIQWPKTFQRTVKRKKGLFCLTTHGIQSMRIS